MTLRDVSCSECYLMFVAPCEVSPHESVKLHQVCFPLFVYVGYHSGVVRGYQYLLLFALVREVLKG